MTFRELVNLKRRPRDGAIKVRVLVSSMNAARRVEPVRFLILVRFVSLREHTVPHTAAVNSERQVNVTTSCKRYRNFKQYVLLASVQEREREREKSLCPIDTAAQILTLFLRLTDLEGVEIKQLLLFVSLFLLLQYFANCRFFPSRCKLSSFLSTCYSGPTVVILLRSFFLCNTVVYTSVIRRYILLNLPFCRLFIAYGIIVFFAPFCLQN